MRDWEHTPWIRDFAEHFNIPIGDVKRVYEVFLGNTARVWPHPFGELADWVNDWDSAESRRIRNAVAREKGWSWNAVGAKILHNEIYRRTPEIRGLFDELRHIIIDYRREAGNGIDILDYGCGSANFVEHLLDLPDIRFRLMDVDPVVVSYCAFKFRAHAGRVRCERIPSRIPLEGDQTRIPTLPGAIEGKYNVIFMMDVLEHTLDPLSVVIRATRALPPRGLFIFNFPDYIEGTWHTPEAHYLRPFCLEIVKFLFTPIHRMVFRKDCDPLLQWAAICGGGALKIFIHPYVKLLSLRRIGKMP
ncbi:MAG: class I SAM-dependent methyltransferase [bacterium]|nr:class I SAM-dependent methyltransferase [bacterium]